MFQENATDKKVREMYMSAPYPFNQIANFGYVEKVFMHDLLGITDLDDIKGKRILDAGCGTGEKACVLARFAKEVVCVDVSSESLKVARETSEKLGLTNMTFIQDSLLNLENIKDQGQFDVVCSFGVLHHISDPYQAFLNILKYLKPGGLIVIGLYHPLGHLNYKLRYKLVNLLAGQNPDKRFKVAARLFYRKKDINSPRVRSKIFDTYVHPQIAFFSAKYIYKNWYLPNNLELKNVHAKFSNTRFMLYQAHKTPLKLKLIDLWYGLRRQGFVITSAIKKQ